MAHGITRPLEDPIKEREAQTLASNDIKKLSGKISDNEKALILYKARRKVSEGGTIG